MKKTIQAKAVLNGVEYEWADYWSPEKHALLLRAMMTAFCRAARDVGCSDARVTYWFDQR